MSKVMELKPIECETCLYDANGRFLGKYNPEAGRGMFAHTFFVDERTCAVLGELYYDWDMGYESPFYEIELSCGHTLIEQEPMEDGMYCKYCGAKVVSE